MSIINNKLYKGFTQLVDFCLTKIRNIFARRQPELSPRRKFTTGFTLIEMMVAVSIFAIVVMISMTAILSIVDANKKAQSLKSVMNNLNFALETMTRTIKTGTGLSVTDSAVSTTDQNNQPVTYSLGSNATTSLVRVTGVVTDIITAPEVVINNLKFVSVSGQKSVVIIVKGTVKLNERVSSEFNIQTTVTQRTPEK